MPLGTCQLEVISLRGHTPGSVALLYRDPQGVRAPVHRRLAVPGRAGQNPVTGGFSSLMDDLESRVFGELPDDTWVYPGHGDDTTLGTERPQLPEWRQRGW